MSGVCEPRDFPAVAIHVEALTRLQETGSAGADDGGNPKVPRDDRAMRKHAAALDDERARVDEQRRPAGIGRGADKDVVGAELLDLARIEDDPRRATRHAG